MAYTPPAAKVAGSLFTITDYNVFKGNDEASAPGVAAAKGDLIVATAANAVAPLTAGANDSTLVPDSGTGTGLAWQIQPAVHVYNDALIDPAVASWVSLTFNQERFDTNAMHSTVSNTNRLTIPASGDGLYLIGGNAEFDASGSGTGEPIFGLRILANGATVIAQTFSALPRRSVDIALAVSTLYWMTAAQYVELQVYTSIDININATLAYSPEFWAIWERRP